MKKLIATFALLFLVCLTSFGQFVTPCFYIKPGPTKGCNSLSVSLGNCATAPVKEYNFGDGSGYQADSNHTYTTPGVYTVIQKVGGGLNIDYDTIVNAFEVITPQPPKYELELCEGRVVNLIFNDTEHDDYSVVMGDGFTIYPSVVPPTVLTHPYGDNFSKNIIIQGNYANTGGCTGPVVDTTIIPLTATIKPDISSVTVNDQSTSGTITLKFNAEADQRYYIQESLNGGAYDNIDTLQYVTGIQNLTYSTLNTSANRYCYQIIAYDDCGNTETSEEICSLINNITASNNQNDINWLAHIPGNVNNYHVHLDGNAIPLTSTAATNYTHTPINCGVDYCYQVIAELNQTDLSGNPLQSISATQCVTGISTTIPAAIQNLNSTVVGNSALVSWDTPVGFSVSQFHISRSENGSAYVPYSNTSSNTFTDNGISLPESTYCYTVDYTDSCGNNSVAGGITCPIVLNIAIDNSNNYLNHLSWTSYTGQWPLGVQEYQVEVLDESNTILNTINAGMAFSYSDLVATNGPQILRYRIKSLENGGTNVSYSNMVEIRYEGEVYLPNAFTPNGDGNNDVFFAKGQFIQDYKLTIFNRWGEVVYSTEQFNEGWDGNYLGAPATPDAYAYLVEVSDLWGKVITKRGSVTLLR